MREENERPEGMEEGIVALTGLDFKKIKIGIKFLLDKKTNKSKKISVDDYKSSNFSDKVVNTIISYINYVNKKNWFKHTDSD